MGRIVITCGKASYWLVFGMMRDGKFPLETVVNKFIDGDTGYIYIEADELEINEIEIPQVMRAVSSLVKEKEPKINVFKD